MPEVEGHSYIPQFKAEMKKYHSTMSEPTQADIKSPLGVWEWQRELAQVWKCIHGMQAAIDLLANRINKLEPKRDKRIHLTCRGEERRYNPDYGVDPRGSKEE